MTCFKALETLLGIIEYAIIFNEFQELSAFSFVDTILIFLSNEKKKNIQKNSYEIFLIEALIYKSENSWIKKNLTSFTTLKILSGL